MKKFATAAIAGTMIAAAALAASTVPASAGNFSLHIGGWGHPGWGPGWGPGPAWGYNAYAPVVVAPQPQPYYAGNNWSQHQAWCAAQFKTYNPHTNLYFYAVGKQKPCNSPFN